ncbi:MAG TPA: M14 family zinc carboxypeptidase [Candidatus Polarisedimenticolaceae bacterium]|nr:M14 family zinc carboxypeptidase [Candidatus Polarisedimenticolaceae bacterium]
MRPTRPTRFLPLAIAIAWTAIVPAAAEIEQIEGLPLETLFPDARFDPAVPSPHDVFGFHPGARPLRHAEVLGYLRTLADTSPRATLVEYARTHEGRELVYLAVADERAIADLERFRDEHRARVDPRGRPAAEDAARLDGARAVAWIAYGIHGDELSSVDAAVAVAYRLVAGTDPLSLRLRDELLVLIDPIENPDGRDRYLAMTQAFAHRRPTADLDDLSHNAVWPWGRGNHYLFDLNRDWFTMVQPESRRSEVIASWNPQLVVDSHEMGSNDTYLFSPARHPFNPYLPESQAAWGERFAADQARALDRHGYPYYTREWNEEFFPGYGSSWASYLGAAGILYEMSGTEGTLVKTRDGRLRTYPQAVHHQTTSTLANLTTLADNRSEILRDFVADRRKTIARAGKEWPAAWILPRGRHPARVDRLVDLMLRQSIEVEFGDAHVPGLIDSRTGETAPSDALTEPFYVVRLDQPAAPLARQLLDPHVPMNAEFFREEREHLERGKGTRLYEVTAWSLPLAYDVDAYWTETAPAREGFTAARPQPAAGGMAFVEAPVGYLIDGLSDGSLPLLVELLEQGITPRVAEKPFRVAGRDYPRSTLFVLAEGLPADLGERLAAAGERHGVVVRAVPTIKAERGPDLGGGHFQPLRQPRVGVWTGWPVSPPAYGAIWNLLDRDLGLRFNALDVARAQSFDLTRYNVLVFPPTFAGQDAYARVFGEAGLARLKRWIEGGGTAIGVGAGAEFLADAGHGLTATRLRRQALDDYPPVVLGPDAERAERAGAFRAVGLRAPETRDDDDEDAKTKTKTKSKTEAETAAAAAPPYDVAPVLGPGARPFARGHEQGTPAAETPVDLAHWMASWLAPGRDKPDTEELERADRRLRLFSPRGAYLRLELDENVWLTWGLPGELPALVRASDTLVAEPPVQVAARFAPIDRLHLGGLLWPEAAGRLALTAYATRESLGRGQVVLFLSEPEFRGFTLGTRRLLVNAILYGPGLGTEWSNPW